VYSSTYSVDLYKARVAATYKIAFLSCLHQIFFNLQFGFPELRILFKGIAKSYCFEVLNTWKEETRARWLRVLCVSPSTFLLTPFTMICFCLIIVQVR